MSATRGFRQPSVDNSRFSMIPSAQFPRSTFRSQSSHKTTFNAGLLVPIYLDEVLPGDSHRINMTGFARMSTPLHPIMDNLHMDTFFFFVPCRLLWINFKRFMGERLDPDDITDFTIPVIVSPTGGFNVGSVYDYFGCPTDLAGGETIEISALPLRAYSLIYNEWFRDENLENRLPMGTGNGPDQQNAYVIRRRGKRHDYFTSCLPWPQKGGSVPMPMGGVAPVSGIGALFGTDGLQSPTATVYQTAPLPDMAFPFGKVTGAGASIAIRMAAGNNDSKPLVFADLSEATSASINQLRQAFQIQRLLERDARGGTRYTEKILAHFGVRSPDARQQRPEYIGGGSSPINISPLVQQSASSISGSATPLGHLGAVGMSVGRHRASYSATEHGYIIGLVNVRADLTYQQGLHRLWSRRTQYDFYWPAFAHLGEQTVLRKEIYARGTADDDLVFGYQERWAEYRYMPSMITGRFRSTAGNTLDPWHAAQVFSAPPVLGADFIRDEPPMARILALGSTATNRNQEFIFDSFFDVRRTRAMPTYSVPGLIDHF